MASPPPQAGAWDALALQGLSLEQQNAELLRCACFFVFSCFDRLLLFSLTAPLTHTPFPFLALSHPPTLLQIP